MSDVYWRQPLVWNREAATRGSRARVFCASMADVFEYRQDLDIHRARLWRLIDETPNLDWLLLTKRPDQVSDLIPWEDSWPHNVWLGTTVETQRWAERRLPFLLQHRASVLFLSCEPLLGPIDLTPWFNRPSIEWVIAGGESGHRARPMNPDWVRNLRDQCVANGIAFHFKQWGNWRPSDKHVNAFESRQIPDACGGNVTLVNVGKKRAGRYLDGQEWNDFPWHAA
jgi:protein gp37